MAELADGYHSLGPGKIASVVTTLEMTRRPAPRDLVVPGLVLRAVVRPEPAWYRTLYRRVGAEWLWFSRLAMSVAELQTIIEATGVEVYAVELDGAEVGLLELDFRAEGACELAFFGLTGAARGRGAGRWLMERALELAWRRPVRRVWVHTCTLDHPAALGFYERSGFVAVSRQVEIADDPRTLGLLAPTDAPQVPLI